MEGKQSDTIGTKRIPETPIVRIVEVLRQGTPIVHTSSECETYLLGGPETARPRLGIERIDVILSTFPNARIALRGLFAVDIVIRIIIF